MILILIGKVLIGEKSERGTGMSKFQGGGENNHHPKWSSFAQKLNRASN